jgi:hypothetical protein
MNLIWGQGGNALFDFYSLNHFGWFMAITLALYPFFKKHTIAATVVLMIIWELVEVILSTYVIEFPLAGREKLINKVFGDPISNFLGVLLAIKIIKLIEKQK